MKRKSLYVLILVLLALLGLVVYLSTKQPSNTRAWSAEQAFIPTVDSGPNQTYIIHNVRDWTYDNTKPTSQDWVTIAVDPSNIKSVWFITEPFSSIRLIGHTFLSFEFMDGTTLDFSVEARREEKEIYSAWRGVFRTYELTYQWGTERDFVTRRLVYLHHPLRMFPLTLSHERSVALFRSLIEETSTLASQPRWYNTLTANCTNVLAHIVNEHYPGTLPYDLSWNLTGLADKYLMREGFISTNGKSPDQVRNEFDLTPLRAQVAAHATSTPIEFSRFIRTLIH